VIILIQYSFLVGTPTDEQPWMEKVGNFFCRENSKECAEDWQDWLSIGERGATLLVDFAFLVSCYIIKSHTEQEMSLQASREIRLNDSFDFISKPDKSLWQTCLSVAYSSFPYLLILYLLVMASLFHGAGMSDFISMGYLFFAFYFIVLFRKLYTKNAEMLNHLRLYNLFVLFSILLFQVPTFECPVKKKDQGYVTRVQCYQNMEESQLLHKAYGDSLYKVIIESIGLMKSNSLELSFVVMVLLTEL